MKDKKIINLGEMSHKSIGFFMILDLKDAVNYIRRNYYFYDIVEFLYDGQPYQLEMKYTLTSQKILAL